MLLPYPTQNAKIGKELNELFDIIEKQNEVLEAKVKRLQNDTTSNA